ncbi:MAG: hypothetical protein KDK37_07775 [Leptospiraceae bacterium]|nr:hypothetical protein [Leptospiraceae bacterium]
MRTNTLIAYTTVLFLALCSGPDQGPEAKPSSNAEEAPDATEVHIQSVRRVYGEAMKAPLSKIEFECEEEPYLGEIQMRKKDGKLIWISYSGGYEHGATTYEALIDNGEVIFAMKEESSWNFDIDHPAGDDGVGFTVDSAVQDRYYFMDGEVLRALRKEAEAKSFKKETLDKKLNAAPNRPNPSPEGPEVLSKVNALLRALKENNLKSTYCGL